ncbi:protein SCAR3 [Amaranthus tricolor]|uniref:protein SCAR3 n=1 Tax=Amaranthus tricolor TaxID=29722 RepID=UPI00258EE9E4|nr:protein SCAR3 [Amaranthus tricolor]
MPLVRFTVKNEYGLGVEELYKDGVQSEDPKAVLDGVAVAGLVGVLRQLGDLAQFAAEIFHGLQEQVASTSSRSRKLVNRVQRIEASLPSLEKAILSQTDHLRFAYTPGTEWHACIRDERNHFIFDDLPHFIMDSYEECKEPPRLQLLDRFDSGGPGSCLKRYSDPTFFRRASSNSEESNGEKSQRERKGRKIKKRRSGQQSGQFAKSAPIPNGSGRMQFSSTGQGQSSRSQMGSTFDMTFKSDLGDQSDSHCSKDGTDFIECESRPSISAQPDVTKNRGLSSSVMEEVNTNGSIYVDEHTAVTSGDEISSHAVEPPIPLSSSASWEEKLDLEPTIPFSSSATWDEKLEIVERNMDANHNIEDIQQVPVTNFSVHNQEIKQDNEISSNQVNDFSEHEISSESKTDEWRLSTSISGKFMEPNGLHCGSYERDFKTKVQVQPQYLEPIRLIARSQVWNLSEGGKAPDHMNVYLINNPAFKIPEAKEAQNSIKADIEVADKEWEAIDSVDVKAIEWNQKESEIVADDHVSQEDANAIEWSRHDLEMVNQDAEGDAFLEGRSNVTVIEWNQLESEGINAGHVNYEDIFSEGQNSVKLIKWNQQELESQDPEDRNNVQVIEWNQLDEIDSGTENFVDALNTIESESESDFETEMKKEVQAIAYRDETGENDVNDLPRITSNLEPEHQHLFTSADGKKGGLEGLESSIASKSLAHITSRDHSYSSDDGSDSARGQKLDVSTCASDEQSVHTSQSAVPSNIRSLDHSYSSNDRSDSERDQKLDVSTCWCDEQSMHSSQTAIPSNVTEASDLVANEPEEVQAAVYEMRPTASASSENMGYPDRTQSSYDKSKSAEGQTLDVSTGLFDEQSVLTSQTEPPDVPQGIEFCLIVPGIRLEPGEVAKSGSETHGDERAKSSPYSSQEISAGSSTSYPHAFWTNGILFGLQPSKPTVLSVPNVVDSAPTSKIDKVGQCSVDVIHKLDDPARMLVSSVNESKHGNKIDNNDDDVGSSENVSHQRFQKTLDDPYVRSAGIAVPFESKVPVGTNMKNASSEATSASEERSSLLSLLSRGLLKNNLRRSGSLGYDECHDSNSKTNGFDNRRQNDVTHSLPEANVKGRLSSPVDSPPPSPPLEHMKISFQPVNGFDTSRLKLKYPEGVDHYENTLDAFPSFQLVPESATSQHDIGSESDNDTFCQSHAYKSDESDSHLSDSDSEQWESGDSTESNDHTIYNGLGRISSAESASISPHHELDHGNMRSVASVTDAHSSCDPSSRFPILDAKNPVSYQEMKLRLTSGADSSHLQEPTHEPPPLPPLQWRVSRPQFDEVGGNEGWRSDTLSQPSVSNHLSDSAVAYQTKLDSAKQINEVRESATVVNLKEAEEPKFGQERTYHAENERKVDDGGNFLQQIRTKSFNLKRTEPMRPTYAPIPATSNKFTAILQKASAIRQAVGSDDGEDDSWSDT